MNEQSNMRKESLSHLEEEIGKLDREILTLIGNLSLVSGAQIRRLYFEGSGNGRTDEQRARRALLRLTRLGVLTRLERRIGGKKFGSEGFCYRLGAQGQRLVHWWSQGSDTQGRTHPEPGERFVKHRLAVSDLYVRFVEAARQLQSEHLEVITFEAEPHSWRQFDASFGGRQRVLKPDAFLRLGIGQVEHWFFCEIDLGTISRRARESQASAYRSYWRSSAAGEVMPRVLWLTPNELVSERVRAAVRPSGEPNGLFVIASVDDAVVAATTPVRRGLS